MNFLRSRWAILRRFCALGCCTVAVLVFQHILAAAEAEYLVDSWQTEHGLPQNTVKTIIQTRDGYLWFGTFDGLVRFDGLHFTVFTVANTPSLLSGDISCFFEDRDGRLWIGTDGEGIVCYDRGKFGPGPGNAENRALKVQSITQTREGSLLVSSTTGLFLLTDGVWKPVTVPESDPNTSTVFSYLARNAAGDVWFTRREKLYRFVKGTWELRRTFGALIGALHVESNGAVLCALNNGKVAEVSENSPEDPHSIDVGGNVWHAIRRMRNGDLWLSGQDGLFRQRDGSWLHVTTAEGLLTNDVGDLHEDREGNLWVGTNGGGLHRLRPKVVQIHSTMNGLPSNDTISVLESRDGRVWVGTFKGGVSVFANGRWQPFPLPFGPLVEPNISSICETKDGAIWFGGHQMDGQDLPHFRWTGAGIEKITIPDFDALRVIFEDREGGLWLGSRNAGLEYRKGELVRRYDVSNGLSRGDVTSVAQDKSGVIWAGTTRGLNRIAPDGITTYLRKDGLGADGIYALWADSDGTLWVGTTGGGLSRFQNGSFTTLTAEQGLLSNAIGQLIEDDFGNLWMGTTSGICKAQKRDLHDGLDGKTRHVPTSCFDKRQGLLLPECANGFQPACMKARDGKLWFCTIGGVVVIDPKRIYRNSTPPRTYIEKVVLDDKDALPDGSSGEATAEIIVPPGTARLELHYTGLNLTAPEEIRFRYRLEGYDPDWLEVGSQRVAHYTHVPPGQYRFLVTAAHNESPWNEPAAALTLRVQPHFRQTIWFRVLSAFAVIVPLAAVIWLRVSDLRAVQALRLRIAHDLHDEAGSSLGSIQLLSKRASKRLRQQEDPLPELTEIQRITASTAESIRDVVWLIDPEFDTLVQMIEGMERVAARLVGDVTCEFRWNVSRTNRALSLEFRTNFFLIYKEILHNISKHARATHVKIELDEDQRFFVLRIRDNGVGFDPSTATKGHGFNTLNHRAAELGGRIDIRSRPGQGTRICVEAKHT